MIRQAGFQEHDATICRHGEHNLEYIHTPCYCALSAPVWDPAKPRFFFLFGLIHRRPRLDRCFTNLPEHGNRQAPRWSIVLPLQYNPWGHVSVCSGINSCALTARSLPASAKLNGTTGFWTGNAYSAAWICHLNQTKVVGM